MPTPYNTGKVLIGSAYLSPPPALSLDAERLQGLLLAEVTSSEDSPSFHPVCALGHWLAPLAGIGALVAFFVLLFADASGAGR